MLCGYVYEASAYGPFERRESMDQPALAKVCDNVGCEYIAERAIVFTVYRKGIQVYRVANLNIVGRILRSCGLWENCR